jgi:ABC-type sugar transport system substrate-binding protein
MHARSAFLFLLPLGLVACKPSPEDVNRVVEAAIAADRSKPVAPSQEGASVLAAPKAPEITAGEGQKLVLSAIADGREPFASFEAGAMGLALRGVDGMVYDSLDARGSAETQREQLQKALERKPAYLLVSPVDEKEVQDLVSSFGNVGTQVISLDERLTGSAFAASLHTQQRLLGEKAAQVVIDALTRKAQGSAPVGRVVLLRGTDTDYRSTQRAEGFFAKLKEQVGIQVVHDAPTDWDIKVAKQCTLEALRLQTSFDVVVAQSDYMALGASQVLVEAQVRENVMIIGMDALGGDGSGIDLVGGGSIDATIHHARPMEAAFRLIQQAEKSGQRISASAPQVLKLEVITPSNALEAMGRARRGEL